MTRQQKRLESIEPANHLDKELALRVNMAGLFLERDSFQTVLSTREQERPDCTCMPEKRSKM